MISSSSRLILAAFICFVVSLATSLARDSAGSFLEAYQNFKTAERLESENDPAAALRCYREAETTLLEIIRDTPRWQPAVVQYRLRRTQEAISRIQIQTAAKIPPSADGAALSVEDPLEGPLPSADPAGIIPRDVEQTLPPVTTQPTLRTQTSRPTPTRIPPSLHSDASPQSNSALSAALRELSLLRGELASTRAENDRLARQLQRSNSQLQTAISDLDRAKISVVELKSQLAQAESQLSSLPQANPASAREEREKETTRFLQKLAEQNSESEMLRAENERLLAKLDQAASYIAASDEIRSTLEADRKKLATQRDSARTEVASLQSQLAESNARLASANEREAAKTAEITRLTKANQSLADQLAEASKAAKGEATEALASLRAELEKVNSRLAEASSALAARDTDIHSLNAQLATANAELEKIRASTPDDNQLLAENELLRGILLRQIRQQTERDEAHRAIELELANLKVESDTLRQQLGILARPVLQLDAEERDLFKDPVALLPGPDSSRMELELTINKPADGSTPASLTPDTSSLPDDASAIREAQSFFDRRDFASAEQIYQKLAASRPDDYLILANLGAVQIESGNYPAAEATLRKAIQLSPDSPFAHTHLGIAYSRQERYNEALKELQEAITIDPTDAVAHNYLGICHAQTGNRDASEDHLKKAIAIDANYADAHFNLAVLYATTKPPSIDLAKQHYQLATELGASPDSSLERLIH
ncbi:MAG: hypothetical protein Fur0032_14250 [Terrimicrobiaceae bacterium]